MNRVSIYTTRTLLLILFSIPCQAENKNLHQQPLSSTGNVAVDPILDFGLILDETFSKPGADFFEIFYLNWQPVTKEVINIRIQEQPGFFRASFILIWINDELFFRQRIPQRYDDIEDLVKNSIKLLNQQLLQNLFTQQQLEIEY